MFLKISWCQLCDSLKINEGMYVGYQYNSYLSGQINISKLMIRTSKEEIFEVLYTVTKIKLSGTYFIYFIIT